MSKSNEYFLKLKDLANNEDISKKCIDNPVYFEEYFKDDTVNVWKDVKRLFIEKYNGVKTPYTERLLKLINSRLFFLEGTFLKKLPLERKKAYIYNMERIEKFFSKEAIYYALSKINIEDFMEERFVENINMNFYLEHKYVIKELNVEKKLYRQKSVSGHYGGNRFGGSYSSYRGENYIGKGVIFFDCSEKKANMHEPEFLKYCILYDFPFMKKYIKNVTIIPFKAPWELEKVNKLDRCDPILFYLNVNEPNMKGKITIPYDCLKLRSVEFAIKIHVDDCCYYYENDSNKLDYHLSLLHSSIFKNFEKDLKEG